MHIQLLHQVGAVAFYCVRTYVQQGGHFFVCSAFGEQLKHFFFSSGEKVKCIREPLLFEHPHVIFQQNLVDGLAEKGLSVGHRLDRRQQVLFGRLLQTIPHHPPGGERFAALLPPSRPLAASPTTTSSGYCSRRSRSPLRTTPWSSAMSTLYRMFSRAVCRFSMPKYCASKVLLILAHRQRIKFSSSITIGKNGAQTNPVHTPLKIQNDSR